MGRLITRVTTDVDAVNELFTSGVVTVFGDLFTLLGIMGVMLAMNWRLALVTFAVLPFFFLVTNWFRRGARESFREVRKWVARINAFLQENLTGMSVVQLFRREERNAEAFAGINRSHADANLTSIFYYAVFYPAIDILAAVAIALILLYGGGRGSCWATSPWAPWWPSSSTRSASGGPSPTSRRSSTSCRRPWPRRSASSCCSTRRPEVVAPGAPGAPAGGRGRVAFEGVSFAYKDDRLGPARHRLRGGARAGASPSWGPPARARPRSSAC